jgi:hypothetical protein
VVLGEQKPKKTPKNFFWAFSTISPSLLVTIAFSTRFWVFGFFRRFWVFGFFGFLGFLTLESAFQSILERSQRISAFVKIDFGQCWRLLPNVDMPEEILLPSQRWRKQGGHSAMLLPVARG